MSNKLQLKSLMDGNPKKYFLFMNKVFWFLINALFRFPGYYPVRLDGMKFKCDPYNIGFWRMASRGLWEPQTYKILSKFLNHNIVYYDIGAWIGPTVLYAAKKCKQVICFEPDTVAYQYLLWNIRINKLHNVMPVNAALADHNGLMKLASVSHKLGDSESSLLNINSPETIDVPAITWETWMNFANTETPAFLKIDIEGGEFLLVPTMKDFLVKHKPIVYLSTHAPLLNMDQRKEQMNRIMDVMGIYNTCLNEKLEKVPLHELIEEDALEHNQTYLFLD